MMQSIGCWAVKSVTSRNYQLISVPACLPASDLFSSLVRNFNVKFYCIYGVCVSQPASHCENHISVCVNVCLWSLLCPFPWAYPLNIPTPKSHWNHLKQFVIEFWCQQRKSILGCLRKIKWSNCTSCQWDWFRTQSFNSDTINSSEWVCNIFYRKFC